MNGCKWTIGNGRGSVTAHEDEVKQIATYSEKEQRNINEIGGCMTDRMGDVGGRRRPGSLSSKADIVGPLS